MIRHKRGAVQYPAPTKLLPDGTTQPPLKHEAIGYYEFCYRFGRNGTASMLRHVFDSRYRDRGVPVEVQRAELAHWAPRNPDMDKWDTPTGPSSYAVPTKLLPDDTTAPPLRDEFMRYEEFCYRFGRNGKALHKKAVVEQYFHQHLPVPVSLQRNELLKWRRFDIQNPALPDAQQE